MDIKILGGNGLHASEVRAVKRMQESLRQSWFGYASLLVVDDEGSMDVDTMIVTHDRLLLVELKEWTGKLESSDSRWYLNGYSKGKSPYEIKRVHAIRIGKLLGRELQHKLGYVPRVEAHVVMCGTAGPENLSTTERRFVHTLDEFLKIAGANDYARLASEAPQNYTDLFDRRGKPRPNSATCRPIFEQLFAGSRVRPKEFSHHSYTAEPTPWFRHKLGLFAEFKGHHQEIANDLALMRRWNMSSLGVGNATQEQWAKVALRENRVFALAKSHERGLEEYLLRPLLPLSTSDVSDDFTELYELRRTFSRLDEHLSKLGPAHDPKSRLDLVRALLAPFSELHALGVAHRDVDLHNLWHASDQRSVVVSGLAAAFFPERGTVSEVRDLLQGSHVRLPEEAMGVDGEIYDAFRQDVFMLAAAAYRILFPESDLPRDEQGIWQWVPPKQDPYGGALSDWLQRALSWGPADRFENAAAMLAALNECFKPAAASKDEEINTWNEISDGEFIKRGWGQFQIYQYFPPSHGENPGSGQVLKYRSAVHDEPVLVKLWLQVAPNAGTHGLNRRVAAFRSRAEKVRSRETATPHLVDFGLLESGGLLVVTKIEPGKEWQEATAGADIPSRRRVAAALIQAVSALHDQQLSHGDIHPGNLLVQSSEPPEAGSERVLLLDFLDFGERTQPFNVEYGPSNPASTDGFGRDRFAVYKLVEELLVEESDEQFRQELEVGRSQPQGVPVSLSPLQAEVRRLIERASESPDAAAPIIVPWNRLQFAGSEFALESDGGGYHFNCKWDKRNDALLDCYVTGLNGAITFVIDPEQRQLRDVRLATPISLSELVSASSRSSASIERPIELLKSNERGPGIQDLLDLVLGLDPVLSLLESKFSPPSSEATERQEDSGIRIEEIWRALMNTEEASILEVEVTGAIQENAVGQMRLPYRTANGAAMDFGSDDRVFVSLKGDGNNFAVLDILQTSQDELVIDVTRMDARKRVITGAILRLESLQSKASRDRKSKAMERVLEHASAIPDLLKYFDPIAKPSIYPMAPRPSAERIRQLYDDEETSLNERQVEAFQQLIEHGPVGVLQGPPGTGKTTFVGAFIHYLFSEVGVRNVLLVGQSHTAVDAVATKARAMCQRHALPLSVVRMGQERMLATPMLDAHSRAIQRQMRHSFHREYEHRIAVFSERLGIPTQLSAELASLHRTLDGLVSSIARYKAELNLAKSGTASGDIRERVPELQSRLDEVRDLTSRIVRNRFPAEAASLLESEDLWESTITLVASAHGINNPAALSRLKMLLSLSQEWLSVLHAGQANYDQFLVQTRQLVCGTLVGMGQKQLGVADVDFDWVIVDEAARAQASELMIPLQSGRRILLVGDHRQLPPVYEPSHLRAASKSLRVSPDSLRQTDFERAFRVTRGVALNTQYRMVEPISDLVSDCFYKDDGVQLRTGRGQSQAWCEHLAFPWKSPVTWIDSGAGPDSTGDSDPSKRGKYVNPHEARLVLRLLQRLAAPDKAEVLKNIQSSHHPIGVITMYSAQKALLEKELSKAEWAASIRSLIRIDTVDSYQGQENPFIILSLVRDNVSEAQGFMWEPSRINVSLSRAQERLAIVGAARMWRKQNKLHPLGRVLHFIEEKAALRHPGYAIVTELPEFDFQQAVAEEAQNA
ncbi:AAA domain-containing protein [Stenotrophomonas sp.]|uniref:AAA domain-containing protein n=1 Tax=Stenotrophomonas sp. TaxID=69392 RepID=UPI0028AEFA32|nr:AAA domain-containing protein [Stenotrophomonas sp.]